MHIGKRRAPIGMDAWNGSLVSKQIHYRRAPLRDVCFHRWASYRRISSRRVSFSASVPFRYVFYRQNSSQVYVLEVCISLACTSEALLEDSTLLNALDRGEQAKYSRTV